MAFKAGDQVRVLGSKTADQFQKLQAGVVAPVVNVWDDMEYCMELLGHSECLRPDELELVA